MVAKELQDTLREITMLGFGLILICHSKEKATNMTDAEGNAITSVEPDLSKNVYAVANSVCDLIAYINIEFDANGKPQRWLYTRQTPTIFAGSRWKYLEPRIPFGYDELVEAIGKSLDKQAQLDGATITDHTTIQISESRPFNVIMDEARTIWSSYLESAQTEDEKDQRLNVMRDIIGRIFGTPDFKLSAAVPSQADLVQLFVDEMNELN